VLIWGCAGRASGGSSVIGLLRAQLLIAIGMLPLNLGVFGEWAPTALLANLVAIPLIGFWVLPLLLVALAGFGLGLPVNASLAGAEAGLRLLTMLLDRLAQLDASLLALGQLALPPPSLPVIVLALIGAAWLLAPKGWPLRPIGALLLLPLLWPGRESLQPGEFDLLLPDLGDGHAVLLRSRDHALLYGTGSGDGAERHQVDRSLEPLLRQQGLRGPDWVVVPSVQRDYAGGAAAATARWPEARPWYSDAGHPRRCAVGDAWQADGLQFRFLHPSAALPELGPDSACVLEVRSAAGSVLLPGPVGRNVLRRLMLEGRARPVDALLLPAAGNRAALEPEWLAALQPGIALASVRAHHPRGLPHAEVRSALERIGVPLATTADCGAIRLRFRLDRAPELMVERRASRRFWRHGGRCPRLR
jgi:competence protein ComEC